MADVVWIWAGLETTIDHMGGRKGLNPVILLVEMSMMSRRLGVLGGHISH